MSKKKLEMIMLETDWNVSIRMPCKSLKLLSKSELEGMDLKSLLRIRKTIGGGIAK